jgi:sulfite reductase alpha subunit-like flavoprotein
MNIFITLFYPGPTNPTWHMEMKDFQKLPQYEYNCETWKVAVFKSGKTIHVGETETDANDTLVDVSIPKVLITFGSETGTAETAAHSLARRMQASKPTVQSLNDTAVMDKTAFGSYSHVLIICSTFGAGNSPQNARAFFECDLREKMKETATINFAVLALGSSLYPDFCKAGKRAHELMVLAGATSMMDIVFADAANGSQSEILRWSTIVKKNVLPESLVAQIRLMETSIDAGTFQTVITYQLKWHHGDDSYLDDRSKQSTETTMRCIANEALFDYDTNSARRSTHHIELEVPAETTPYETGDHLSVMPKNSLNMVTQLCECFGHELENAAAKYGFYTLGNDSLKQVKQLSHSLGITPSLCWLIHQPLYIECIENGQSNLHQSDDMTNETLLHVLQEQLDFSFHSLSYFLDLLSMLSSRLDKTISTKASRYFQRMAHDVISRYHDLNDYDKAEDIKAKFPTVVHLLEKMKSLFCEPIGNRTEPLITLGDVLVMMPKLKPRFYSIASSSVTSPRRISLLVGAVNNITKAGIVQEGVCSCYLKQLKQDDYISAKVVESTFRLPVSSYSTPVILVGTGTGLAPFIGFLSERADVMKSSTNRGFGKSHLFFGCRNEAEFIMEDQINEWDQNNVVDAHITYSRSLFKPKNYVQDAIKNHGEELANLILSNANGANVYICGDAHIAKLCSDAFVSLLQEHGKMSKVAAVKYISGMYHTYRWQLDVWGETNAIVEDTSMGLDTSEHVRMEASRHAWQGKFNSSFASNGKGTISE